jgi:hypothetical protein
MPKNILLSCLDFYIKEKNNNIQNEDILEIIDIICKLKYEMNSELFNIDDFTTNELHWLIVTLNFYIIQNNLNTILNNERKLLYNIKVIYDNRLINENYNF